MDEILQHMTWIDWTSLAIVVYFLVMGLFRGFLWQASRLVSLVLAYVLAGVFGHDVADFLAKHISGIQGRPSYYIAYFSIFIAVLITLSLLTILLDRFVRKLELSFFNHVGGGLLGFATAVGLIVAVLGLLYRLLPGSPFVVEAKGSYTGRVSRVVVQRVGLPGEIRSLYDVGRRETESKKAGAHH